MYSIDGELAPSHINMQDVYETPSVTQHDMAILSVDASGYNMHT